MYNFKPTPELVWAVVVTAIGAAATLIAAQGETPPTDWKVWVAALVAGVARAVIGLILDKTNAKLPEAKPAEDKPSAE